MTILEQWDKEAILGKQDATPENEISLIKNEVNNSLISEFQEKPEDYEKLKDIELFYKKIDRKLFEIDYTCMRRWEEMHKWKDRRAYMEKRIWDLISLYDDEKKGNFFEDQKLAEKIWFKDKIKLTFHYWIIHLTDIYNDGSLNEKDKLFEMSWTVVFLKSLLSRNVNL